MFIQGAPAGKFRLAIRAFVTKGPIVSRAATILEWEREKRTRGKLYGQGKVVEASGGGEAVGYLPFVGVPVVLGRQTQGHQTSGRAGAHSGEFGKPPTL